MLVWKTERRPVSESPLNLIILSFLGLFICAPRRLIENQSEISTFLHSQIVTSEQSRAAFCDSVC